MVLAGTPVHPTSSRISISPPRFAYILNLPATGKSRVFQSLLFRFIGLLQILSLCWLQVGEIAEEEIGKLTLPTIEAVRYTPAYEFSVCPISPNPHHVAVAGFAVARICPVVDYE